ncbi:MAG TPA: oligoendopeptidase F [Patescibacteria group bacterium]|nr:oligoendopeptidase F [Patescibacteria group bacterium]
MLQYQPTGEAAAPQAVSLRSEIPAADKWRLEDIYANESLWQDDVQIAKQAIDDMAKYKGKLDNSAKSLLACLKLRDRISLLAGERLYAYARMRQDEDTADNKYQALTGRAQTLLVEASAASSFIEPEILAIPDKKLAEFRRVEPGLKEYAFFLDNLERQKKHVLSPAEEELLSRAADITRLPTEIYQVFTGADMKFPNITDETGSPAELSQGRYGLFIKSPDRNVRKEAFEQFHNTYKQYRNTFAATLNGHVKKDLFYSKVRHYNSSLEASLDPNQIPAAVYDNLITTVNNHLDPLHRYVALKKKLLGLQEIHMYDLYVPLVKDASFNVPYEEGIKMVQEALTPLGPDYGSALRQGLQSGWVDVYENKGKRSGAYSWGVYGVHPFVLLNYNNQLNEVSTIAHELGHALHSYYSNSSQPYATADYAIFTAETASTTNENLLINYLLRTTQDKNKKIFLVNQYLENIRTTVYRQTMFAEFEKLIHEKAQQGETLTADVLEKYWHDLNVKYFGPEMIVDGEIDAEWSRIPHFYRSFYVYQYATGFSAACAFAEQLEQQGAPAAERYINRFLKAGGSDTPINILKNAGVDMSSPAPVEITLKKFDTLLNELEELLKP